MNSSLHFGGCIVTYIIDPGVYDLDIDDYVEFINDYIDREAKKLKLHQIPKFLEGVQVGIEHSIRLLELVSIQTENLEAA